MNNNETAANAELDSKVTPSAVTGKDNYMYISIPVAPKLPLPKYQEIEDNPVWSFAKTNPKGAGTR